MFSQLKQAGVIARDLRFHVCMATPLAHLWTYVDPEHQPVVEQPLLAGFANEIEEILAVVPAAELGSNGTCRTTSSASKAIGSFMSTSAVRSAAALVPPGRKIPAAAELGFHFCYGDSGGKHSIEPRDTEVMAHFAMTSPLRPPGRSAISIFRFRSSDPTRGSSLR